MADEKDYLGVIYCCECCKSKAKIETLTKALEDISNNCNPDEINHSDFYFLADEALKKTGGNNG